MSKPIFCLIGPTACGKTACAFELVQRLPMEIVSIDSTMIYREMNIGSAKPDADFLALAPHHLIDILDPTETYSAAQCCVDVAALCKEIFARNRIPLLVGGTMMYFNALQRGLAVLPDANPVIRESILQEAGEHGWEHLHAELAKVDAEAALRIHPNDTQRLQRALEVFRITGTPLSILLKENQKSAFNFINYVILPEDRSILHQRIAHRLHKMLADGLIDEVEALLKKWPLKAEHPSMRSVGYRQVLAYLKGEDSRNTLAEKAIAATRQMAKRQYTWLRHWSEPIAWVAQDTSSEQKMIAKITQMLDNL